MVANNATALFPRPDANSFLDLFTYVDTTVIGHTGAFGFMILMITFGAMFMALKTFRSEQAFAAAMFVTGCVALGLAAVGLVAPWIPFPLFLLAAVVAVFMIK